MLPYYGLILFVGVMYLLTRLLPEDKTSKVLVFSVFVATTLLQCLRAETVGCDIVTYLRGYEISFQQGWFDQISNWEKGFLFFLHLLSVLNVSNRGFIVITSIMCQAPVFYFIYKRAKRPELSILIYFAFGLFLFSFSGIRQMIAIGISLLAVLAFEEGRTTKSFILFIIAVLFHRTSIINFLIIPLSRVKVEGHGSHLLMLLALFLEIRLAPILVSIAEILKGNSINIQWTGAIGAILLYALIWLLSVTFIPQEGKWISYSNYMYLGVAIQCLGLYHMHIARLGYFFTFFECLLIPEMIDDSTSSELIKTLIYLGCIMFCLFYFHYGTAGGYLNVSPYIPFWKEI